MVFNPKDFYINSEFLPERFTIVGAIAREGVEQGDTGDRVVIGIEDNPSLPEDRKYCSWLYNPNMGFAFGHYALTRKEAIKDLTERI